MTFGILNFSATFPVGLENYLVVAALIFSLGLLAVLTRRNAIGILIGIELMLNAAVLNFLAFSRFHAGSASDSIQGPIFSIFIILLAACEAAIALAILLNLYFNFGSIDVDRADYLKR